MELNAGTAALETDSFNRVNHTNSQTMVALIEAPEYNFEVCWAEGGNLQNGTG